MGLPPIGSEKRGHPPHLKLGEEERRREGEEEVEEEGGWCVVAFSGTSNKIIFCSLLYTPIKIIRTAASYVL